MTNDPHPPPTAAHADSPTEASAANSATNPAIDSAIAPIVSTLLPAPVPLSKTAIQLMLCSGLVSAVFLGVGLIVIEGRLQYLFGVLLGYACCCLRIFLLDRSTQKSIDMQDKSPINYARAQFMLRYALTTVVLVAAALLPDIFNLIGAVLGVISMQFGAYLVRFIFKGKS